MAGDYNFVTDSDGNFIGVDQLDNLGDAYEALEACVAIINSLADATGNRKTAIYEAYIDGYCQNHIPPENMHMITFYRFWYRLDE